ncbi:MAG TPA: zinc-binding alcohol dehydrogenase family protein, partial [Pseudomonadales bacterium]|nr:zinc-binding alcohol dehydrogenase family protein [Pseudomonadales bacterium]
YTTLPRVPGRDFAGVVEAGPAAWLGKEVWGTGRDLGFFNDGSHAEYVCLPASGAALKPASLSFAQAASCGVPYTTAWDALERNQVRDGTQLLIIGAGAVAQAAIDLARLRGANVLVAVRREEVAARLRAQSVAVILLQDAETLAADVKAHFAQGAQVIFDTTGFWLPASIGALANFGRIGVIAAPPGGQVATPILNLYRRGGSIVGTNTLLFDCAACAVMLNQFAGAFDCGQLPAPADFSEVPFADALSAYQRVNDGWSQKIIFTF